MYHITTHLAINIYLLEFPQFYPQPLVFINFIINNFQKYPKYKESNTYTLKRKILTFTNKISRQLSKPEKKFVADITYGMLASGSCLLTDVVDQLHESSKKINIVDRLSRHLDNGTPASAAASYLHEIKKWVPSEPVIHIDDNDVVKPDGYKFEALGIVRDGPKVHPLRTFIKKAIM